MVRRGPLHGRDHQCLLLSGATHSTRHSEVNPSPTSPANPRKKRLAKTTLRGAWMHVAAARGAGQGQAPRGSPRLWLRSSTRIVGTDGNTQVQFATNSSTRRVAGHPAGPALAPPRLLIGSELIRDPARCPMRQAAMRDRSSAMGQLQRACARVERKAQTHLRSLTKLLHPRIPRPPMQVRFIMNRFSDTWPLLCPCHEPFMARAEQRPSVSPPIVMQGIGGAP